MNPGRDSFQELRVLTDLSLEGTISPELVDRLESLILQDPQNCAYYCEYINLSNSLERSFCRLSISAMWEESVAFPDQFWVEASQQESQAPAIKVKPNQAEPVRKSLEVEHRCRRMSRVNLLVAAASFAAFFTMIVYVHNAPVRTSMAVVYGVLDPVWPQAKSKLQKGDLLFNTDAARFLQSGVIQLEFHSGVKTTIEGPAVFSNLTYDQVKLHSGKLYATVPPEATGFTVCTPGLKIVDLGTEFGVRTEADGSTELHVFCGKAILIATGERQEDYSKTVSAGSAKAVSRRGGDVQSITLREDVFVRAVDFKSGKAWRGHRISLADIVGGGNGLGTGGLDHGILVDTGELTDGPEYISGHGSKAAPANAFTPVPRIAAVDGVFVPDGGQGPVIISSQGHVFKECPNTSAYGSTPIINGAKVNRYSLNHLVFDQQACGTPENPSIFLHANVGITYDLQVIRKSLPGEMWPGRFTALAAAAKNIYGYTESHFDIWVLVDGQLRFSKTMMGVGQSVPIDIPLTVQDRFLSIVVTDGIEDVSDVIPKNHCDWCLLVRPELLIEMK